jgi:hypothetical protein
MYNRSKFRIDVSKEDHKTQYSAPVFLASVDGTSMKPQQIGGIAMRADVWRHRTYLVADPANSSKVRIDANDGGCTWFCSLPTRLPKFIMIQPRIQPEPR